MSKPVSLREVLDLTANAVVDGLHTCLPGKIVNFYPEKQTADVQAVVKRVSFDEDGERVVNEFPTFSDIPVQYPRGGGFVLVFPLVAGDHCLLVFSEIPTGEWRETGQVSEPFDVRRHGLSGAFCIPGIAPDTTSLAEGTESTMATKLVIGKDSGSTQIHVGSSDIKLGASATDFVALSSKVDDLIDVIKGAYNIHTHASFSAPPSGLIFDPVPAPSCAAALVKAQ